MPIVPLPLGVGQESSYLWLGDGKNGEEPGLLIPVVGWGHGKS